MSRSRMLQLRPNTAKYLKKTKPPQPPVFDKIIGFPGSSAAKNLPIVHEMQEMRVWSLDLEDPLKREMATHSSILAWEILLTEEPGRL